MDNKTDLLTEKEAAELLRISARSLAEHRRACTGPRWYDLGSGDRPLVRYRQGDLDAWLASRAEA